MRGRPALAAGLAAVALLLIVPLCTAQIPLQMNYQVMLTDDLDEPLADTPVQLVFRMYDAESGGVQLWAETHNVTTNSIGVASVVLGSVSPPEPIFSVPLWLQLEVDGELMEPRRPLTSAPYAIRADVANEAAVAWNAENLDGIPAEAYTLDNDLWHPGVLNDPSNPIDWTKLKSMPAGFADGTDDGGGIGGGGTADYVPKFTGTATLGNSSIFETGGRVAVGTTTTSGKLTVESTDIEPALSLTTTLASTDARALYVRSTNPVQYQQTLIEVSVPSHTSHGHLIDCLMDIPTGGAQRVFSVDAGGQTRATSLLVDSRDDLSYTIRANNIHNSDDARAIQGFCYAAGGYDAVAVYGESNQQDYYGVGGRFVGGFIGAEGKVEPTGGSSYAGLYGTCSGGSGTNRGVRGYASGGATNYGVYGSSSVGANSWAGYFEGDARVTGTFTNPGPVLEMDHPSDPENSYLRHALVASPEMKTVHDGTVDLDATGAATVELPDWFEDLNGDFRYQLTPIGGPAPSLHVAETVSGGRFRIAGGEPGMAVSWQVTGVRGDAYARHRPLVVEQEKAPRERGRYLTPEAHGASRSSGIGHVERKKND